MMRERVLTLTSKSLLMALHRIEAFMASIMFIAVPSLPSLAHASPAAMAAVKRCAGWAFDQPGFRGFGR